jgi:hypothetical protein
MSERSQDVYAGQIGPGNIQMARTSAPGKQRRLESKGETVFALDTRAVASTPRRTSTRCSVYHSVS